MSDITLANFNMLFIRSFEEKDQELHLPLGPLYLVSVLEHAGIEVDFRDYQLEVMNLEDPFSKNSIAEFLKDPAPIVGISCMANLLPFVILGLKQFKEAYPDRIIILGGVGPWAVEEKIMERFPWIDIIAKGEAESYIIDLVITLKQKRKVDSVPGIVYRKDGKVVQNPRPPRITELDQLPFPAYHKIPLEKYEGYGMISSRGCPYPCTFCSVMPIWDRKATFRSINGIVNEMEYLQEKAGVDLFLFQDEFFVSTKKRVLGFCNELKKRNLKVKWKAFGRVDLTDEETMEAMAEAGCIEIRYGIESGSDRILEITKKGFTVQQAIDTVSKAVNIFPRVDTFFIWGFPFETMEDFKKTLFRMISFRMIGARVLPSLLCLLPQTEIYRYVISKGLQLEFCEELFPEYMVTGHEIFKGSGVYIDESHRYVYDFIKENPDLFPGFFHIDLKNNIKPKLRMLQEFGFYPEENELTTESCGAHSPRLDPRIRGAATTLEKNR